MEPTTQNPPQTREEFLKLAAEKLAAVAVQVRASRVKRADWWDDVKNSVTGIPSALAGYGSHLASGDFSGLASHMGSNPLMTTALGAAAGGLTGGARRLFATPENDDGGDYGTDIATGALIGGALGGAAGLGASGAQSLGTLFGGAGGSNNTNNTNNSAAGMSWYPKHLGSGVGATGGTAVGLYGSFRDAANRRLSKLEELLKPAGGGGATALTFGDAKTKYNTTGGSLISGADVDAAVQHMSRQPAGTKDRTLFEALAKKLNGGALQQRKPLDLLVPNAAAHGTQLVQLDSSEIGRLQRIYQSAAGRNTPLSWSALVDKAGRRSAKPLLYGAAGTLGGALVDSLFAP